MKRSFTARIRQEDEWFIAQCLEIDVASQGPSRAEALRNLSEALELHFEDPRPTIVPELEKIEVETGAA